MILCVDVGNSFVKFARVDALGVELLSCTPTAPMRSSVGHTRRVVARLRKRAQALDAVVLASVVPDLDHTLKRSLVELAGLDVFQIDHATHLPFRLAVERPETLGSDRICAAAGTISRRLGDAIVVDVGSAVTVDLLHRGAFKGGMIIAGPALGLSALGSYAKRLPVIPYGSIREHFPNRFNDTRRSMILGAHLGTVGAIKEGVRRLKRMVGGSIRVFATGGGVAMLSPRLPKTYRVDPNLVLKGMYRVWLHAHHG